MEGSPLPATPSTAATTLAGALGTFLTRRNAQALVVWCVVAVGARIAVGGWTVVDLAVVAVLVALQPIGEWVVHRVLMRGPAGGRGRVPATPLSREHEAHHEDHEVEHFMPLPVVAVVAVAVTAACWAILPTVGLALTAAAVLALELLAYVVVHFLLHADHEPAGRWLGGQRRRHLAHHRVDHTRDLGVVTPFADLLLGTVGGGHGAGPTAAGPAPRATRRAAATARRSDR
jgi:sterol desaturase/sphingolipid hydroxylase (fatty acid hydroxylase superfamily)